jgi:hypothetical protein
MATPAANVATPATCNSWTDALNAPRSPDVWRSNFSEILAARLWARFLPTTAVPPHARLQHPSTATSVLMPGASTPLAFFQPFVPETGSARRQWITHAHK